MLSISEFRRQYDVSKDTFKRVRRVLEQQYPEKNIVSLLSQQLWIVNQPELFLIELVRRNPVKYGHLSGVISKPEKLFS